MSAMRMSIESSSARAAAIDAAAAALTEGKLAVIPTDTVYGIAADAFRPEAVARLLAAKGRGRQMPPPVLVSAPATVQALGQNIPDYGHALIEKFWPGPLTVIVEQQPSLLWDLGETRGTVAVRMPDHEVALELLERTGPLAVSSANKTSMRAATDADEAERMLSDRVEVIVDAGPSPGGEASTIVDITGDQPRILREGAIGRHALNEVLAEFDLNIENA